jgi:lysophospholipase L1-like esterase
VRFLALGDSYTIGEGVSETQCWPNQLADMLRARGMTVDRVQIIARTAWTTDELADALSAARARGPYDLVSLQIGVNDQYRGRPVGSFQVEFANLLRRATSLAAKRTWRVVAISIPDWGASPFALSRDRDLISREISEYNAKARDLSLAAGAEWVDITQVSRRMLDDPRMIASDGLHPSGEMYREWAEAILPTALGALTR